MAHVMYDSSPPLYFSHLENISISFGNVSSSRSAVVVATTTPDGYHIEMDYGDDDEISEVEHCIAYPFSHDRMPNLKNIFIQCSDTPMSTLKMTSFLRALLKVRMDSDTKMKCIRTSATFMPQKLIDPNSEFRRDLDKITEKFVEIHRKPYLPGQVVVSDSGEEEWLW